MLQNNYLYSFIKNNEFLSIRLMNLIYIFRYSNVENFSIQTNDFPSRYRLNVKVVQEFICHQIVSCLNLILVL